MDSERGMGAVRGSAPWTANGEWELCGVQHHGQRTGNGSCAGFSTVDSGQGTGEVLRVQHRG